MTPEEKQLLQNIAYRLNKLERSDRYVFQKHLQLIDGRNVQFGTSVGTRIGTSADEKLAFFGATPVAQQPALTTPSGGATVDAAARSSINEIITLLQTFGFTA